MPVIAVLDAGGISVNLLASGAGSVADPHIPVHTITGPLPAGAAYLGQISASVIGTPYSFVGGSVNVLGDVRASIIGVPSVVASVVGTPNAWIAGSVNVLGDVRASVVGQPTITASVIGTIFAVVNTGAVGTQFNVVGGSVNVLGDVRASLIGVPSVVASIVGTPNIWVGGSVQVLGDMRASLIGTPNVWIGGSTNVLGDVRASLIGVPSIVASVAGTPNVWIGGSVQVLGDVRASIIGVPAVVASVVGAPVVLASVSGVHGVTISSINVAAPQPVHFFGPAVANMGFTSVIIQLAGSGVVVGNLLASSAARVAVAGFQIVAGGTCYFAFYDGTINAPLTGSISLIPNSGMVVAPSPIPLMLTSSGRGITAGLSASCPIAGTLQYWVPPG